MTEKLLIDAHYSDETRIAIINENGDLENFEAEYTEKRSIKGNIYLAKIVRIEPAIQAAFIEYGGERHGFIPLSEIHFDYFDKDVANEVEVSDADNIEDSVPHKKMKDLKIQDAISTKQRLLVQAEKEVRGNKCAFFTTFISLPGRYCVLMPNPPKGKNSGISKKIEFSEKERLREILESLEVPDGMGCIVRTAGENKSKQEIKRDLEYLCRLWNELKEKVNSSDAPLLVYEEGNIIKRTIRDLYNKNIEKILIQGQSAYKEARTFMKLFTPSHVKRIERYEEDSVPIFQKYKVEEKIRKILDPVVLLPSGGSIVINTTEALTAIDVNSGKMRSEKDINETALRTNLEAVTEIANQIRLRDIAGIIVIDFIDMLDYQSVTKIEKKMRDAMKGDYSNIRFSKISSFGLMEISRQRLIHLRK
jgi:ribonuclease E